MSSYLRVPHRRLAPDILQSLLEEYASRDGTDYGAVELTLEEKAGKLRRQLEAGEVLILYQVDSEQWDLVDRQQARALLQEG